MSCPSTGSGPEANQPIREPATLARSGLSSSAKPGSGRHPPMPPPRACAEPCVGTVAGTAPFHRPVDPVSTGRHADCEPGHRRGRSPVGRRCVTSTWTSAGPKPPTRLTSYSHGPLLTLGLRDGLLVAPNLTVSAMPRSVITQPGLRPQQVAEGSLRSLTSPARLPDAAADRQALAATHLASAPAIEDDAMSNPAPQAT